MAQNSGAGQCYNYTDALGDTGPTRVSIEFFSNNFDGTNNLPAGSGFTGGCRPVDWDPADPNATLPWYAVNGQTEYLEGTAEGWLYKAVLTTEVGGGLTVTDSGYTAGDGSIIWQVTATLPAAFTAQAGTTYWVGMDTSNQAVAGTSADYFAVMVKGGTNGTNNAYEAGVGTLWGGGFDFQYVLEGAVPEPATMSLLGLGGLGLLIRRKR